MTPRCSLHAWGRRIAVSFPPERSLLSGSFTSERVLNASLRLLRRLTHLCFTGGRPLLPPGARARVTYCSGGLVSGSPASPRGEAALRVCWVRGTPRCPARCARGHRVGSLPHARPPRACSMEVRKSGLSSLRPLG